jgi:hypothetical protein
MPYFRIRVRQDAWINHDGVVEAATAEEAAQLGEAAWKGDRPDILLSEDSSSGFDHAECDPEECEEISAEDFRQERALHARHPTLLHIPETTTTTTGA